MSQKETLNGTVKNHHFDMLVSFECRDDLVQLRNGFGTENVEWRVVKRDSPNMWARDEPDVSPLFLLPRTLAFLSPARLPKFRLNCTSEHFSRIRLASTSGEAF
jgi:hypothetical protein